MSEATNKEGLTWPEWSAAAGLEDGQWSKIYHNAWLYGEDPADWRKDKPKVSEDVYNSLVNNLH